MKNSTKIRIAGVVNLALGLIVWFVPAAHDFLGGSARVVAAILIIGAILPQFVAHKVDRAA